MARLARRLLTATLAFSPLIAAAGCRTLRPDPADCSDPGVSDAGIGCMPEPTVGRELTMHALGSDLDHLEKHIDWYGSVVAKNPDVWGAARLTSYRQETETQMRVELNQFTPTVAGGLGRVDTANLLIELAFQDGLPKPAGGASADAGDGAAAAATAKVELPAPIGPAPQTLAPSTTIPTPAAVDTTAAEAAAEATFSDPNTAVPGRSAFAVPFDRTAIGLEPTRVLAQKLDYLNTLNQYRRGVEGDDTSDAPGYSLNLLRVPVSLLPGKRTDTGHGAEITFTVNPVLDPELLPRTTRDLIVNDVVALFDLPLTKALEDSDLGNFFTNDLFRQFLHVESQRLAEPPAGPPLKQPVLQQMLKEFVKPAAARARNVPELFYMPSDRGAGRASPLGAAPFARVPVPVGNQSLAANFRTLSRTAAHGLDVKGTRAMPATIAAEVYGPGYLFEVALLVARATAATREERDGRADMPEVQAVLKEHLVAAHRFLERPENAHLWPTFCNPAMVEAVRSGKLKELTRMRAQFRQAVRTVSDSPLDVLDLDNPVELNRLVQFSAVAALAWGILVDAALLNERLIEDVRRTASAKGVFLCPDGWPTFTYPDPPAEVRALFAEYVKVRWPIHVFTVDPADAEQNVSDSLTVNRNTQLALTLGFLEGVVSTNALLKATRDLQAQYDTVALNRTQVGFTHGENVFGWRFYPRFQTPDTQSNAVVFLRDNLIGGPNRNALLRQRRLEPGPRECTAIVLMPSFVPYATLDSVGNWFSLVHPKHKVLDHTQALKLSRTVQAIKTDGCGVTDAQKYREGDLRLLQVRADQLSARLPFQAAGFQVPVLNTLTGFELFGNATTNLAPELAGWYGSPGATAGDRLFLVGDHFSVNNTSVIVGNRPAKIVKMLSRQVVEVQVPDGFTTVEDEDGKHVHVVVATPYGVSRELELPVFDPNPTPRPVAAYSLSQETLAVTYTLRKAGEGKYTLAPKTVNQPTPIFVKRSDPSGSVPKPVTVAFTFEVDGVPKEFPVATPLEATADGFAIPTTSLLALSADVIAAFDNGPYTRETNPLRGGSLKATRVTVTPSGSTHATRKVVVGNLLELQLTPVLE